jgi:hypothetical protein
VVVSVVACSVVRCSTVVSNLSCVVFVVVLVWVCYLCPVRGGSAVASGQSNGSTPCACVPRRDSGEGWEGRLLAILLQRRIGDLWDDMLKRPISGSESFSSLLRPSTASRRRPTMAKSVRL